MGVLTVETEMTDTSSSGVGGCEYVSSCKSSESFCVGKARVVLGNGGTSVEVESVDTD